MSSPQARTAFSAKIYVQRIIIIVIIYSRKCQQFLYQYSGPNKAVKNMCKVDWKTLITIIIKQDCLLIQGRPPANACI